MDGCGEVDELEPLEGRLREAVRSAAERGWRGPELAQAVGRNGRRQDADLVAHLDAGVETWRRRHRLTVRAAASRIRFVTLLVEAFPRLPAVDDGAVAAAGSAVLARVRALLAKAESTTFEPEAEALTAKAHELMARHAIDRALVTGALHTSDVVARRVLVGDPYARARFVLLGAVARAYRCRAVWWSGLGVATVFGMSEDLDAFELMYTSLVLQATAAVMRRAPDGRVTPGEVAAYRRSFLYAFAARIRQRLVAANARVEFEVADRLGGESLLPVLRSREAAVEAAVESAVSTRAVTWSASHAGGWAAGVAAAERADLGRAPSVDRSAPHPLAAG